MPRPATSLVGRGQELATLLSALEEHGARLLTITGPGGSGKTRFALELAARAAGQFEDGAHFVALAPLAEPSLAASAIAQTIGLVESGTRPIEEVLEQRLREGELLLVVDNVEH